MKTLYKQTVCIVLFVAGLLLSIAPVEAQEGTTSDIITISGAVKDKQSRKKLEYVNISVVGTNIGTITNSEGEFSIKFPSDPAITKIELSHIGYLSAQITVNGANLSDLTVFLTANANVLDEVVIRARDPRFLVEEALEKVPQNYSDKHNMLTGFYRETAQKGRRYITISEAIIDIYKTPYSRQVEQDRVQIYKGRKLLSQKNADTLVVKLLGGPNLSIYLDIVKNPDMLLEKETLSYYSFRMEEPVMIDDRPQYVINFQPQVILPYALYYGKLYIDKEKLAFTRAEFNLNMDDKTKATQAILKKKPFGLRFNPTEVSFLVNYKQQDDKTYLSYIRNEVRFKCDWKRRLFSTNYTILSEMVVTDMTQENITNIPYKVSFKSNQSLSDKVSDFEDDDFWGNYNVIEPTESLESAVNKLRKQKR